MKVTCPLCDSINVVANDTGEKKVKCAACGAYFQLTAERRYRHPSEVESKPSIGGWLILPAIGLILNPFRLGFSLLLLMLATTPTWVEAQFPGYGSYYMFTLVTGTVYLFFTIFTAYLFFGKRASAPGAMIVLLMLNVVLTVINTRWSASVLHTQASYGEIGGSVLLAIIWVPYFLFSKRVKLTFVRGNDLFEAVKKDIQQLASSMRSAPERTDASTELDDGNAAPLRAVSQAQLQSPQDQNVPELSDSLLVGCENCGRGVSRQAVRKVAGKVVCPPCVSLVREAVRSEKAKVRVQKGRESGEEHAPQQKQELEESEGAGWEEIIAEIKGDSTTVEEQDPARASDSERKVTSAARGDQGVDLVEKMKRNPRLTVIWAGIALIVAMGLCPPWRHTFRYYHGKYRRQEPAGYGLIFWPPTRAATFKVQGADGKMLSCVHLGMHIDITRLFVQWALIAAVVGGLLFTIHRKPSQQGE